MADRTITLRAVLDFQGGRFASGVRAIAGAVAGAAQASGRAVGGVGAPIKSVSALVQRGGVAIKSMGEAVKGVASTVGAVAAKINAAGEELSKAGAKVNGFNEIARAGSAMTNAGQGIAQGLLSAGGAAVEFEQKLADVRAVAEITEKELQQLSAAALDLSQKTRFSASEALGGAEELAKAGIKIQDIINGGLDSVLKFATAGEVSVSEAAEFLADAKTVFKDASFEEIINSIAGAANASSTSFRELVHAARNSVTTFKQLRAEAGSIDEWATVMAIAAGRGIKGMRGGTGFRTAQVRLAAPTDQAASLMREMGIITGGVTKAYADNAEAIEKLEKRQTSLNNSLTKKVHLMTQEGKGHQEISKATASYHYDLGQTRAKLEELRAKHVELAKSNTEVKNALFDAQGNMVSYKETMVVLAKATEGMTQKQKVAKFDLLFGNESTDDVLAHLDAHLEAVKRGTNAYDEMHKSMAAVTAEMTADTKMDSLSGSFAILKSTVTALLIEAFYPMLDTIRGVVDWTTEAVRAVIAWVKEHPKLTAAVILITAGIAALLVVVGGLITAFGVIAASLTAIFAFVAGPAIAIIAAAIGWVVAVVAAIGAVIYALYSLGFTWKGAWNAMVGILAWFADQVYRLLYGINQLFVGLFYFVTGDWEKAIELWSDLFEKQFYKKIMGWIDAIIEKAKGALQTMKDLWEYATTWNITAGGTRAELGPRALLQQANRAAAPASDPAASVSFAEGLGALAAAIPGLGFGGAAAGAGGGGVNIGALNVNGAGAPEAVAAAVMGRLRFLRGGM
jgi:TP901 family phage tail tape measure protein